MLNKEVTECTNKLTKCSVSEYTNGMIILSGGEHGDGVWEREIPTLQLQLNTKNTGTHKTLPNIHSTLQNRLKITFPERQLDGKAQ